MTKKDYELIALAVWRSGYVHDKNKVRQEAREKMRRLVATNLMSELAQENPRFDKEKFLFACRV